MHLSDEVWGKGHSNISGSTKKQNLGYTVT